MASKRKLKFRNYQPTSGELKSKTAAVALPAPILEEAKATPAVKAPHEVAAEPSKAKEEKKKVDDVIARELEAHAKEQGDAGDLLNIAPRKPNWDLKRDLSTKMEKLNKRTKYAIVELIKQRIEAESNADEDDET